MWCMKKEGMKESREDYLETILVLNRKSPDDVRPVDVANHLGITKPSVTRAMTELEKEGHIRRNEKGRLLLTESGREIAEKIYERHLFLSEWLERLGVDAAIAASDACKMEHVISSESFEAIKNHINLNSKK